MTSPWPWDLTFEVAFSTAPGDEPGVWTDLSDRLRDVIDINTGRGRLVGGGQGTCTLQLNDADRDLDPSNSTATHSALSMRHARLTATVGVTTFPLFRGFVDAWAPTWDEFLPIISVSLVDGFAWLALQDADLDMARQMSHERTTDLLDLAGWPAGLRDIGDGVVELEPFEQNSANLLRSLEDAVDAEGGDLYVAPDGKLTFRSRHARFNGTAAATFGCDDTPIANASPAWDAHWITNIARVELADGDVYEAIDDASVDAYGKRVYPVRDLALRSAEAEALAQWEVVRFAAQHLWIDALEVAGRTNGVLPAVLPLRVGDLVTIDHAPAVGAALNVNMSIERIQHRITKGDWRTLFDLSPYFGAGPWMIWDDATHGWDMDALWAP